VLTPFPVYVKRPNLATILRRNHLVAHWSSELLIVHAEAGGKVEKIAEEALSAGKQVRRL
jgi:hypothetical protein